MNRPMTAWCLAVLLSACGGTTFEPADAGADPAGPDAGTAADAGAVTPDAGGAPYSGLPGTAVAIDFPAQCPAATACGGDPGGAWIYTGACLDDPFPAARKACAGLTVTSPTGTVRGTVRLLGGLFYRDVSSQLSATLELPSVCAPLGCGAAQTALAQAYPSATCATATGGGCRCQVAATERIVDSATYSISGSTLTATSGARTSTYEFCVSGATLQYRETTSGTSDTARYSLTKQ